MTGAVQLKTQADFERYEVAISGLLAQHQQVLLDDANRSGDPALDLARLVENTRSCLPWIWLWPEPDGRLLALGALSDIQPGRHAFLHGVSEKGPNTPQIVQKTVLPLLQAAFEALRLLKVKAEFEADNYGALGFCRRLGFRREARFQRDICIQGVLKDVLFYSLDAERFHAVARPRLIETKVKTPIFT